MGVKSETIFIGGMSCVNCQNRIEKKLKSIDGVESAKVNYTGGSAAVSYNEEALSLNKIKAAVEELGYKVLDAKEKKPLSTTISLLVIIISLWLISDSLGLGSLSGAFPLAGAGTSYAMLFIIGLITSLHCAAMCGGINLSQCLRREGGGLGAEPPGRGAAEDAPERSGGAAAARGAFPPTALHSLMPSILYNLGRLASYTLTGAAAGALGSALTIPEGFRGGVQLLAGVFMVLMGVNMLGLFPGLARFIPRLPSFLAQKSGKLARRGPLIVGLLNGLMPCGPLQAMQLYALSSGSPIAGAVSMFLFGAGTIPLMFGIGVLSSLLSAAKNAVFSRRVLSAGAVLITVMGLSMFGYGWSLSALGNPLDALSSRFSAPQDGLPWTPPQIENGVQIVNSTLSPGRYPAITVQRGMPVRWTINAPPGSINGCNNRMIVREYGIEHRFAAGENIIEFMPEKSGRFSYSCWMGMIRSSITVVEEGALVQASSEPSLEPAPAGAAIPVESAAIAELEGGFQTVRIELRDDGIEPALIIVQRGVPAVWTINNNSLDAGNSRLIVPAYYQQLNMRQGDNVIQFAPTSDFEFSTGDNVFYGFVKVVDNLKSLDKNALEAIKTEVAAYPTMIYPEAYFESASLSAGGCCGL